MPIFFFYYRMMDFMQNLYVRYVPNLNQEEPVSMSMNGKYASYVVRDRHVSNRIIIYYGFWSSLEHFREEIKQFLGRHAQ